MKRSTAKESSPTTFARNADGSGELAGWHEAAVLGIPPILTMENVMPSIARGSLKVLLLLHATQIGQ